MSYVLIDPDETLDYSFDWQEFLEDGGSPTDVINTSSWSIVPQEASPQAPVTANERQDGTGYKTIVDVSGAVYGQVYRLTNRIVTSAGRTAERSIILQCEHR